jgi:hypothetical protein
MNVEAALQSRLNVWDWILCENRFNSKTIFKAILATLERII